MATKQCKRVGCPRTFDNAKCHRREYCSDACKASSRPVPKRETTSCPCGKPVAPRRQKYCSDSCAIKGLFAAIERQRERREAEKRSRPRK